MSFNYKIYSEQEAMSERYNLLKEGIYDAVIISSEDKHSASSGNPMMDLRIGVFDDEGKEHEVRDFLVFTPKMMWKVVHFAESANLMTEYERGGLCSQVAKGERLRVKVVIEEGSEIPHDKLRGKMIGSRYPDKNKIDDYLKRKSPGEIDSMNNTALIEKELNDDVPF